MANSDAITKYLANRRIENAANLQERALVRQQKLFEEQQRKIEEAEQARLLREAEEQAKIESKKNAGFFEKLGYTIADVFTELGGGLFKLGEGVVDAALTLVGGTFWGEDIIKFNAADEWWYSWEDKLTEKSYMNDAPIVKDIVRGVGQQLPTLVAIAAAPFTGGASLAALPYTIGATVASAGGQGAEEALTEGANGFEALGYGVLQAGIEGLVEYATAGMGKGVTSVGKSVAKSGAKSVAKSAGKVLIEEALSEAAEEGISALLNPLTKTIYKGGEALEEYKKPEFYKDVGRQAFVGGVVGGISGGAGAVAQVKIAGGKANYNIQQSIQEVQTLNVKEDNLWKNSKLTSAQETKIETARKAELDNISKQLKSMEADKRAEAIKKYDLQKQFNSDGDVIEQVADNTSNATQEMSGGENTAANTDAPIKPLISHNKEAYSPSLKNTELLLAPTSEALTEAGQSAKNIISKLGGNSRIVVTNEGVYNGNKFDAFYDNDSRTVYVNNNADPEAVRKRVAVHEITHTLEGTKQYGKLADYVRKNVVKETTLSDGTKKVMTFADLVNEAEQNYSKTVEGKSEKTKRYVYESEVVADLMGELLSNEQSISRLANSQKSIAYRVYSWVKDAVARLKNKGDMTSGEYRFLRKVEKLYANAMRKSAGGISIEEVEKLYKAAAEEEEAKTKTATKKTESEAKKDTAEDTDDDKSRKSKSKDNPRYAIDTSKKQDKTSAATSINSRQIPTLFNKVEFKPGTVNLDIGGGKFDNATEFLKGKGVNSYVYDPYNRSTEHNQSVISATQEGRSDTVTISNVLNVIDTAAGRAQVLQNAADAVKPGGIVYITVYEGDGSGEARVTGKDQFQLNKQTKDYIEEVKRYFAEVEVKNKVIIASKPIKENILRYSLVKGDNDLVAIHNLSEEKMLGILELGGFPMPSIAVTKPSILHDNFGQISVVFDKSAVDPKMSGNTAFPGDAYSPRFPNIGYKINSEARNAAIKKVNALLDGIELPNDYPGVWTIFNNENIENDYERSNFAERNLKERTLQLAYLKDKGIDITVPMKEERIGDLGADFWEKLSEVIPADFRYSTTDEAMKYEPIIRQYLKEYMSQKYDTETAESMFGKPLKYSSHGFDVSGTLDNLDRFRRYGKREIVNTLALDLLLEEKVDKQGFKKWLDDLSMNFVEKKGIRNNVDYFTPMGNRRSFEALHYDYTLQNIIKAMKAEGLNGAEGGFFGGSPSLLAARLMERFKSIEEMKSRSDVLELLTEADNQKIRDAEYAMLSEISRDMVGEKYGETSYGRNTFDRLDGAVEAIGEIADKKLFATDKILAYLEREYKGSYTYNSEIAQKILTFFEMLRQHPTTYFEAKPLRAVGFDEVKAVIIPADASAKLKTALQESGLPVKEYAKGESRQEVISKLDNVRFSLKDGEGGYKYSKGQISRYIAEHSKTKAYTRTDAEQIVNTLVGSQLSYGDKYGDISGKTRKQVVDMLWHSLNTKDEGFRTKAALDIAEFIIDNAVMEDIYGNDTNGADVYIVNELRRFLHNVDLSGIKGEIKHRFDTDNSPYLMWGKRKGVKASAPDQIAMELEDSGIRLNSTNEADIFFEIDDLYRNAVKSLKKAAKERLTNIAGKEDLAQLKQEIAREILISYDTTGHQTKFARTIEKYTSKISALKAALKDAKTRNKATNNLLSTVERAKNYTKYVSADVKLPEQVVRFVKEIAKIETWRGNLNKTARTTLAKINDVYKSIYGGESVNFNPYADAATKIAGGEGELTVEEIRMIDNILQNFIHEAKNYDKVFINGKAQSESETAEKGVHEAKLTQKIRKGYKGFSGGIRTFFEQVYNPYRLMQSVSGYKKGSVMETLYGELLEGNRRRAKFIADTKEGIGKFTDDKAFMKTMREKIALKGDGSEITMTRAEMLSLYLTMKREQGLTHLINAEKIRLLNEKYVKKGDLRGAQIYGNDVSVDEALLKSIEGKLSESEKGFVEAVREFLDKTAKDAKVDTDMLMYGVTNALEENYYPLKTSEDELYSEVGTSDDILQTIKRFGFNIDTVPNAKTKLVIESVFDVLARHIEGISIYHGYAVPITTYNRVMNSRVDGLNMQNEIDKINPNFRKYMNDLFLDLQRVVRGERGRVEKIIGWLRWGTANSALALNPKVLLSQTVSLASALSEFNPKYVGKGISGIFSKRAMGDVLKYSPLMAERNDYTGNIDVQDIRKQGSKLGKAGDIISLPTKLIDKVDSRIIASIYQAALNEQADIHGYKIDSEENKIAAARRTEEVVFRSQQTTDPIGRSSLMRSKNELVRMFTMFHGDAFQLTSQFISSVDRILTYRKMLKSGDAELVEIAKKGMPEAKKTFAKSGAAVLTNVAWLTLIATAVKWLKGFDDDEKTSDFVLNEMFSNFAGMLPLGSEFFSVLNGYDLDNPAYSAISTIGNAVKDSVEGVSSLIKGDKVDEVQTRSMARKTALGFAQMLGVPLRNVESYTMGIVGKVSPATKAEYDAQFKTKSNEAYMKAISDAIEKGDHDAADRYLNIMFNSRTGKIKDDKVLETMRNLIEAGYTNVLPKSLGDSITYNGEKIELTKKQHEAFKKIYSEANDKVKTMVNAGMFATLDDAAKAKAIKTVYDYYYNLGLEDLLGEDLENKNMLFCMAIPIEQLAMAIAQAQQYEADLDKGGNIVQGSRKTKVQRFVQSLNLTAVQKYMIMGYLGYANLKGSAQVKNYINGLSISKTQKETLYEMSGYKLEKKRAA